MERPHGSFNTTVYPELIKDRSVSECCVGSLEFSVKTRVHTQGHPNVTLDRRECTLVELKP